MGRNIHGLNIAAWQRDPGAEPVGRYDDPCHSPGLDLRHPLCQWGTEDTGGNFPEQSAQGSHPMVRETWSSKQSFPPALDPSCPTMNPGGSRGRISAVTHFDGPPLLCCYNTSHSWNPAYYHLGHPVTCRCAFQCTSTPPWLARPMTFHGIFGSGHKHARSRDGTGKPLDTRPWRTVDSGDWRESQCKSAPRPRLRGSFFWFTT